MNPGKKILVALTGNTHFLKTKNPFGRRDFKIFKVEP